MKTNDLETHPRKRPSQERSRATVDAMIEATRRLIVAEGLDALTTNRIAEVAGVSVGTLYQYYPSKEALVAALIERELERDLDLAAALLEEDDATLRERFERMIDAMLARARDPEHARLHAQLLPLVPTLERHEHVRRRVAALREEALAMIWGRRAELKEHLRGDPSRMARAFFVASHALEGAFNAAKTEAPELLDAPGFAEDLRALLAPLLSDPPAPRQRR